MSRQQVNKMTCAPSGDSDQPGHLPILIRYICIQFFIFQSHRNLSYLATHWVHIEDLSDCADNHVDLILPWEPSHFVGFVMRWLNYGKTRLNQQADYYETTGAVAQLLERPACVREVVGSIPGRVIPDFQNGISCSFVCDRHWESGTGRSGVSIMWLGGMSRHVSEVWYVREAALLKWALSFLSHPDTVAI